MLNSALYRRGAIKRDVPYKLVLRYYWKSLIGTCGAWLLYAFSLSQMASSLASSTLCDPLINKRRNSQHRRMEFPLGSLVCPGVFLGAYLCDRLGLKNTMMSGFSGYLVFGLTIGISYDKVTQMAPLFVVFYGLM